MERFKFNFSEANKICYNAFENLVNAVNKREIAINEKFLWSVDKKITCNKILSIDEYITIINDLTELKDLYPEKINKCIYNIENKIYFLLLGEPIFHYSNINELHDFLHKFNIQLLTKLGDKEFLQKIEFIDLSLSKLSIFEDLPLTDSIPYKVIKILKDKRKELIACRPIYIVTPKKQNELPEPYGSTPALPSRASRFADALGVSFQSLPRVALLTQAQLQTLFIKLSESSTSFVVALLDFLEIRKNKIYPTSTALYNAVALGLERSPDTIRQNFASLNEKSRNPKYHAFDQVEAAKKFYNTLVSR